MISTYLISVTAKRTEYLLWSEKSCLVNLSNSLGMGWEGAGRVRPGLMFPSKVPDLRMCSYSMLQGREGGRERGHSNLVGASCSFVSMSTLWFQNYYYKAGFLDLSTIDILGPIFFFFLWEAVLCIAGCLATSLAFIHWSRTPSPSCDRCLQTLPNISWMYPGWEPLLSHLTWTYPISFCLEYLKTQVLFFFLPLQSPLLLCYIVFNFWWRLGKGIKVN